MFYRIEGNTGDFTFYIFMRAKKTVDGNRGGEDGGKKIQRGLSPGKRRKGGEVRRYAWGHEGESRQCVGKHKERRKK